MDLFNSVHCTYKVRLGAYSQQGWRWGGSRAGSIDHFHLQAAVSSFLRTPCSSPLCWSTKSSSLAAALTHSYALKPSLMLCFSKKHWTQRGRLYPKWMLKVQRWTATLCNSVRNKLIFIVLLPTRTGTGLVGQMEVIHRNAVWGAEGG